LTGCFLFKVCTSHFEANASWRIGSFGCSRMPHNQSTNHSNYAPETHASSNPGLHELFQLSWYVDMWVAVFEDAIFPLFGEEWELPPDHMTGSTSVFAPRTTEELVIDHACHL
jgi:hypothetical protein